MRTYFTMLLVAAVVSFLATPLARRIAFRIGAVDTPGPRKIHRQPTARLGGLAVVLGFCAPWTLLYIVDNQVARVFHDHERAFAVLSGSALALFLIGVADDVRGLSARRKFALQTVVAGLMFLGGFRIDTLSNPFGEPLHLGWLALPATVLWIVGLTNATNLLDGMDGLVTGVAALMALSLAMINVIGGNTLVALLTFSLAGAALGFLPYNFAPARIFLGDSGSLFLGLMMAGISTLSLFKAATATIILVPVLLFALPLLDTTQVVIGRLRRGQHPFSPDKTHVHHRLLRLGFNQRQAVLVLYGTCLFLGVAAILLSWRMTAGTFLLLGMGALALTSSIVTWARRVAQGTTPSGPNRE